MKKTQTLDQDSDFFSGRVQDDVVILTVKGNILLHPTVLRIKSALLGYLDLAAKNKSIKAVVVRGNPGRDQREDYRMFYSLLVKSRVNENHLLRTYRVFDQFLVNVLRFDKVTVFAHEGDVIQDWLNISLAANYRLAATNTVFHNPSQELGLVPKGGGGYLLRQIVGRLRAEALLLSDSSLTAQEALQCGLLNEVVSGADLYEASLSAAKRLGRKAANSLPLVRGLMNHDAKELEQHLEKETRALARMILKSHQWRKKKE